MQFKKAKLVTITVVIIVIKKKFVTNKNKRRFLGIDYDHFERIKYFFSSKEFLLKLKNIFFLAKLLAGVLKILIQN